MSTKKTADTAKLKNIVHRAVTLAATTIDTLDNYGEFSPLAHYASVAHTAVEISGLTSRETLNVVIAAAYLHDFIEDVKSNSYYDLKVEFGKDLADLVWAVSGFGRNRDERLVDKFTKIQKTPAAYLIFAADRISNLRAAVEAGDKQKIAMYLDEHDKVVVLTERLLGSEAVRTNTGIGLGKIDLGSDLIDIDTLKTWYDAYLAVANPAAEARRKRKAREAKKASKPSK